MSYFKLRADRSDLPASSTVGWIPEIKSVRYIRRGPYFVEDLGHGMIVSEQHELTFMCFWRGRRRRRNFTLDLRPFIHHRRLT
jgi:hypothetical protein